MNNQGKNKYYNFLERFKGSDLLEKCSTWKWKKFKITRRYVHLIASVT
jgi:hypothetical protein